MSFCYQRWLVLEPSRLRVKLRSGWKSCSSQEREGRGPRANRFSCVRELGEISLSFSLSFPQSCRHDRRIPRSTMHTGGAKNTQHTHNTRWQLDNLLQKRDSARVTELREQSKKTRGNWPIRGQLASTDSQNCQLWITSMYIKNATKSDSHPLFCTL